MERVNFADWQKIDLRVGEIREVEELEGSEKLYKLKVDIGTEERVLVAGLKSYYSKEELIGKRCVVFTNLEKKKIRGVESDGMLLAAVNEDQSKVRLLEPDGEIELGSKIF